LILFRVFGYTESVETIEENEMTKLEMKVILLARLESLAKAWANGDVRQCVGILDRAVYSGYLNGFEAGFLADIVDEQVFTTN
jgi:hypothetical protein